MDVPSSLFSSSKLLGWHHKHRKSILILVSVNIYKQAIQSPRTIPFFLLISLLDGNSFANVHVKGIVAFKH